MKNLNSHTKSSIKISTSHFIDETKYEIIDVVQGVCIRSFGLFRRTFAGLTSLAGGKLEMFEEKYQDAYHDALINIVNKAKSINADAIYGLVPDVSELSMGSSDGVLVISIFGTAVRSKLSGGSKKIQNKKLIKLINF